MSSFIEEFRKAKKWQDKCLLIELVHLNMVLKDKKWSLRDTAKAMKISLGTVSEAIQLAECLHEIPKLNECNSRNSALKLLRKRK